MRLPDLVARDHDDLLGLSSDALETLERDRRDRRQADRLVAAATRHLAAEELYLWPVVRDALPGATSMLWEGRRRATASRRLLRRLDRRASGDEMDAALTAVVTDLREHVHWERHCVLTELAGALPPDIAALAGRRYAHALGAVPTRPHRLAMANPAALKLLGPVAARTDRWRDLLTRRAR